MQLYNTGINRNKVALQRRLVLAPLLTLLALSLCVHAPAQPTTVYYRRIDSIVTTASHQYANPSWIKRLLLGKNYRKAWATTTTVPVFYLSETDFEIEELGGGQQTKSLQLEDRQGVEWALRTVDKDVRAAIPRIIRNKFSIMLVQELISAGHPYTPLIIPTLAKASGVTAAEPTIYYVADDPALGEYRKIFANKLALLERRDIIPGAPKSRSTKKAVSELLHDNSITINQPAYLRARLLDMLIADWDRHYDQWRWHPVDSAGRTYLLALPRDRDQAMFRSDGLLVKFLRQFVMKHLVGFTETTSNLKNLSAKSWNMDLLFLNQLNESDWKRMTEQFQRSVTDDVIRSAVKKLPKEIYALNGEEFTSKLISRKNSMAAEVLKYYRFLAGTPVVYGTDQSEIFELSGNADSITISVLSSANKRLLYKRSFYPGETKKIRLLGLGGNDTFTTAANYAGQIEVEADGGTGKNEYRIVNHSRIAFKDSNMHAESYFEYLRKWLPIKD